MQALPLGVVAVVVAIGGIAGAALTQAAQAAASDADLERASAGRTVAIGSPATGQRSRIPLETYVARVIAGEAEPNAPDAAKQAIAVAIRTFAVANRSRHGRDGYDLCDTTHCQVPRAATASTRTAALATAARLLTFNGTPAQVFYSANCGGHSETASEVWPGANLPYLQAVPDDVHEDDLSWTLALRLVDVQQSLSKQGFRGELTRLTIESRNASGRVSRLRLDGLQPDAMTGEAFRMALGPATFRSTAFSLTHDDDRVRFTGQGYGHGVGMCVVGAARRARRGETVADILHTYFPGLALVSLDALGL
jgi:stage II sporulation protein D